MKFVFAFLAIAAVAHGFVIPSFDFEVQQGKNVIDEFVREAILFVEQIVKAKEPVTLPDLGAQTIKDTDVDITLTLSGVKVDKFDNLAINNLKNDFPLLSASFDVSAPAPHVEGNFEVSGTVMQKAVSGKGTFSVDLDALEQSGFVQIQIVGNSIQIEKLTLDYTLPDAKISVTGLTVDGMTPEQLNEFLSSKLVPTLNANKAEVCKRVANHLLNQANGILKGRSLAQVIQFIKNLIPL